MRAMVVTHTHAKDQGQTSLGSKDRVETDGQTDRRTEAIALPPVLTRSVDILNYCETEMLTLIVSFNEKWKAIFLSKPS